MFSWQKIFKKPLIIAHRGASTAAPENTMAAFKKAIEDKSHAIEVDVRLTRDNEVVVIHDSRLERTTNGRGKISDYCLKDLQTFDNGSWFHPKFSDEKILTLSQMIKLTNHNIGINIEIKPLTKRQDIIVEKCIALIQSFRIQKRVLISSFQHSLIKKVKSLDPTIMTGIIYSPVIHFGKKPAILTSKYNANAFIISKNYLRENMVKDAHENNLAIFVYTVNDYHDLERMIKFEVDGVMTNSPRNIYRILEARR